MLAKRKTVIAHVDDKGGIEFAPRSQSVQDAAQRFVDRKKSFGVGLVRLTDRFVTIVGEVYAVPTIALVLNPHRTVARHISRGGHGRRRSKYVILILSFVPV